MSLTDRKTLKDDWKRATQALNGYHIHMYFHDDAGEKTSMDIAKSLQTLFPEHVDGIFPIGIVGPHSTRNTEVEISKDGFADIVSWLQINAPENLSILIHPETNDVVKDHTVSAMWLGAPVPFNQDFFDRIQGHTPAPTQQQKRQL